MWWRAPNAGATCVNHGESGQKVAWPLFARHASRTRGGGAPPCAPGRLGVARGCQALAQRADACGTPASAAGLARPRRPPRPRSLGALAPGEAIGGRWVRADVLARGTGAGAGRRRRPWAGEAAPTPRPRALARWCRAPGAGDLGFLANFATTYADCSPITARLLGFGLRIPRSEKGSGGDYSIGAPYLA